MDALTFVIIVVFIGCATGVINNVLKNQRERHRGTPASDVLEELDALRARVETLEEIVTDGKYHLKKEIDQLERSA
jgi:hypothetical protein